MGLDLDESTRTIGRFEVMERTDKRLLLFARSRTQTHHLMQARWYLAALVVALPALGASWDRAAAAVLLFLTSIAFAIVVMIDFMRLATEGKIASVEHRFDLEPGTEDSYRGVASAGRLVIDDRALTMPIRDVRVLSETIPRGGEEVCRVYVILDEVIVALESTKSRVVALRIAGLVRKSLGMAPLSGVQREMPVGTGGGWAVLFFFVALVAPMICAPMGMALAPSRVAALGAAFVVVLVGLEHVLAIPMREAAGAYIERNLRT
jgi:hypothetical protein